MSRLDDVRQRLIHLEVLKTTELALPNPSQSYVSDLNDSIAGCKNELRFLKKNPNGVEFVNGV